MSIVSSLIAEDRAQRDGRRSIIERHTDHRGAVHVIAYLAEALADAQAALTARVAAIELWLSAKEVSRNIESVVADGSLATVTLQHSTVADNRAALRLAYATATRFEAVMIGDYLNTLTDAQLRTVFSMTQAQVDSLRANKLGPAATLAASIRAAAGQ